ncbi:MAG: protein YgfX [Methylomicrobium sp.]
MSSHHFVHPAQFSVGASRYLKQALLVGHGLALIACLLSVLPWPGKLLLSLALPAHLYFAVKNADRQHVTIRYLEGSGWHIDDKQVMILPSTVLTPFAVWLHFTSQSARKRGLLIVKDTMPDAEFRQLIVKLKISAA